MKRNTLIFVACALLVLLSSACKPRIPVGILSESKMEDVLHDYHLAQGAAEQNGGDTEKNRYLYVQAVFQKHGITEAEFDSSLVWYSAYSHRLQKIYERLYERYDAETKSLGVGVSESEVFANMTQYGDTSDIWSGSNIIVLQNDYLHGVSTLSLKADLTFKPGDNYALHFHASFTSSTHSQAYAFLNVFYKDGTTKSEFRILRSSYDYNIQLPDDITHNDRETDRINISFYFTPEEGNAEHSFMCIERPILARFHRKTQTNEPVDNEQQTDSMKVIADTTGISADSVAALREIEHKLQEREKEVREGFELNREKAVRRPMRSTRRNTGSGRRR